MWCDYWMCVNVLHEVWNDVKVWSRHRIFRKENIVSILLLGCIDLWASCEWDDPDSTYIIESHKWSWWDLKDVHMNLSVVWNIIWSFRSYEFTLSHEMMGDWDDYAHGCVDSQRVVWQVHVWMLISVHEYFRSRVKCLCIVSQ